MNRNPQADSLLKASVVAAGKKKREGDNFLEQLKRFLPFPSPSFSPFSSHDFLPPDLVLSPPRPLSVY